MAAAAAPPAEAAKDDSPLRVAFVGDSTLDNVLWVEDQASSVTGVLGAALGGPSSVWNLAADGFTVGDVLFGAPPRLSFRKRQEAGDPVPGVASVTDTFKPLELLEAASDGEGKDDAATHAILSVGGNDVRECLSNMAELPQRLLAFQKNYPAVLDRVRGACPQTVLMMQYRPCATTDETYYGVYTALGAASLPFPGLSGTCTNLSQRMKRLNALLEFVYEPILAMARDAGIPVIDLPNSLDPMDDALFKCQIEPSHEGGQRIAALIEHVVRNHDYAGKSLLYTLTEGHDPSKVVARENTPGYKVTAFLEDA